MYMYMLEREERRDENHDSHTYIILYISTMTPMIHQQYIVVACSITVAWHVHVVRCINIDTTSHVYSCVHEPVASVVVHVYHTYM